AYLFSACCEIGAILGGANVETQLALRDYGMNLGAAFQLVDDLLDFTATDDVLGKAAGVDLLEGKLTLQLIYLLETERGKRAGVQSVMRDGSYEAISRATLVADAERAGATRRARTRADAFATAAGKALDVLPDTKYRDALSSIPTFILERDS
ncbi:MAG TPA: polyprenyl synthetase family protein, partial [Pyrinomonadaceae bacterium]|nr:polyprenyl synthetase family protein [Pyrinomonadaceae bacterium]